MMRVYSYLMHISFNFPLSVSKMTNADCGRISLINIDDYRLSRMLIRVLRCRGMDVAEVTRCFNAVLLLMESDAIVSFTAV